MSIPSAPKSNDDSKPKIKLTKKATVSSELPAVVPKDVPAPKPKAKAASKPAAMPDPTPASMPVAVKTVRVKRAPSLYNNFYKEQFGKLEGSFAERSASISKLWAATKVPTVATK